MPDIRRLSIADGVSFQDLGDDEGAVVLLIESGQLFTCNETTSFLLRSLRDGHDIDSALREMLQAFEVEDHVLRADVDEIVASLLEEGILKAA